MAGRHQYLQAATYISEHCGSEAGRVALDSASWSARFGNEATKEEVLTEVSKVGVLNARRRRLI